jgi:hypothetical protein
MIRARATAAAFLIVVVVALAARPPAASSFPRGQQGTPAPAVEIGAGPIGDRAFALTGRSLFQPDGARFYGYLTAAIGLTPEQLFASGAPSERTARFTYVGSATRAGGADRGDVTTFDGDGALRIYLNEPGGATWDDPASFGRGTAVAEFSLHARDTIQRQAPGVGVVVGDEQLTQTGGAPFTLDGQPFRFGAAGIAQRLRTLGAQMSGAPAGSLLVGLAGAASVTARPATIVHLEASPPPAAPQAGACPPLQPWLGQTQANLDRAKSLAAAVPPNADVTALDAAALSQAAKAADDLATAQRQATSPTAAADANRLALTALSTQARALQVIATAATNRDADLLAKGRPIMLDGDQLLDRARQSLADLGRACPGGSAAPAATP